MIVATRHAVIASSEHMATTRYKYAANRPPRARSPARDELSHKREVFIFAYPFHDDISLRKPL